MSRRACRFLFLIAILWSAAGLALAQESRFAATGKFGSLGPGLDLTYGLKPTLNTRLGFHYTPNEELALTDDIRYAGSLLLDWHPGGGKFRLSGGLAVLGEQLRYRLSGENALREKTHDSYTTYVGIGWGNALRTKGRWSLSVDLGAFGGGPGFSVSSVEGRSSGAASTGERKSAEDSTIRLHTPHWRPVISTGVSYRF